MIWSNNLGLSENVQDIRQSHKINHGSHKKLQSGINSQWKSFSRGENPKKHHPGRYALALTICNCSDVPQLLS